MLVAVPDSITIGQEILTVRASDALDYGDNALVEYSVSEGNGSSLFGVTRSNGSVYAKGPLADVTGEYRSVLVKAIDLGSPPLHSTVTVTMLITADNQSPPTVRNSCFFSSLLRLCPAALRIIRGYYFNKKFCLLSSI